MFFEFHGMKCLRVLALAAAIVAMPAAAPAQDNYPNRPIKIVVPLAAGGAADLAPRMIAEKLAARWTQPVVIENRPGAGHTIGAEAVAKADPDGYTLFATPQGPLVTSQLLYAKLSYDPAAFTPVTILTTGHVVLIINPKVPASNLTELVAYAKANPGKLTYASPGFGTSPHVTGEWLKAASGIQTTHVPYKGLGPAVIDLLAGHVDMMFDNLGNSLQHIRGGKLRAIAVAGDKRIAELPDVPAVAETYPGFNSRSWFVLVAPPKTPPAIAEKLSKAVADVLRELDVVTKLRELSLTPVGNSPAEAAAYIRREAAHWREALGTSLVKSH
jgi:tripartite-type tricarboxylate transporter receptor subunit TctC